MKKTKILAFAAALILLIVTITTMMLRRVPEIRAVKLQDGSQVSIRQVSVGKEHRFVDGSLWHRMLRPFPTNLTTALGVQTRIDVTKEEMLVLWVAWENCTSNRPPLPQWVRVIDSHGLASLAEMSVRSIWHSNNTLLAAFHVRSFPRHEPMLRIELDAVHPTQPNAQQHVADFHIRNPQFIQPAREQIRTLPQTKVEHGQEFTLLEINSGLVATGTLAQMSMSNQWTEFVFRIGTNAPGQRTTNATERGDWSIKSITLRDAYGNYIAEPNPQGRFFPLGSQYMMRKDDGIALARGAIWPGQNWNVVAEFQPNPTSPLDASHRGQTSIRLPMAAGTNSLSQTTNIEGLEGMTMKLRSIERVNETSSTLTVELPANFLQREPYYQFHVLEVVDQRGTNIVHTRVSATKNERRLTFRYPTESTELRVTLAVTHPVTVEFTGQASVLRTNVARWVK